jgi:hypothetical protein
MLHQRRLTMLEAIAVMCAAQRTAEFAQSARPVSPT